MEIEESTTVSNCEQLSNVDEGILNNSLSKEGSFNEMEKECVGGSEVDGGDGYREGNQSEEKERCVVCQKIIISESSHPPVGSSSGSLTLTAGPSHEEGNGKEVPKAVVRSNFLKSLNGIWPYLQTFWRKQNWDYGDGEDGGDTLDEDDLDWKRVFGIEVQRSRIFCRVPTVCQLCADKVQAVSDLMQGLKSHLRELRKIILEGKKDNSRLFSEVRCPKEEIASEEESDGERSFGPLEDVPTPSTSSQSSPTKIPRRSSGRNSRFNLDKRKRKLSSKEKTKTSKRKRRSVTAALDSSEHSKLSPEDLNVADDIKVENLEMDELADLEDFPDLVASPANQLNEMDDNGDENEKGSAASPAVEEDDDDDDDDKTWNGEDEEEEANNSGDNSEDDDDDDNYSSSESEEEYVAPKRGRKPGQKDKSPRKSAKDKPKSTSSKKPFKCDVANCTKSFTTNRRLTYHQKRNHPDKYPVSKTYNCTCGKIFTTTKGRLAHLRTSAEHKGEEIFVGKKRTVCDMCGQQETFDKLEEHVRGHVGDYAVKCPNAPQCQYVFTNFLAIPKHLERVKSCRKAVKSLDYSCESCEFKTDKQLMLRTHLILNHERTPENMVLPCPIFGCGEKFSVRQSVHYHLKTNHRMRQVSSQRCVECGVELKVDEMSQHLKGSHQAGEIISCPYCPCLFPGRVYLVDHLGMHKNESPTCDLCRDGVKFSRYAELREHYYQIHQIGVKEFICDECGKEFWNKNSLSLHIKLYHTGEYQFKKKTFPCEICYEPVMEFSSEDALICHKINMHGAEPFRCKICGVTFTAKAAFVRHERDHQGIRRKEYKCEVKGCEGKTFNSRKMLNQHNELVHEGVRYDCELCGKTYTSGKNLKKHHQNSHLKLRPFVCDICGDRFVAKAVMIRHKLIHTGERPYVCAICGQRFRQPEVLKRHMDAHERKGEGFKPNGPMKQIRKRQGE